MRPSEALLNFGNPVAYYPGLAEIFKSVNAALFFSQIFFWKGKEQDPDLGIFKSAREFQEETGLTIDQQRTARKTLREIGVLIETEKRLEHKIFYRLDLDLLDGLIESSHSRNGKIPSGEMGKSHFAKSENPIRNKEAETTTETTTETTGDLFEPSQEPSKKEKSIPPKEVVIPEWMPLEAWNGYVEMRKSIKAPLTARAKELAISELERFRRRGLNLVDILDQSTTKCWRGLFEVKEYSNGYGQQKSGPRKIRNIED